MARSLSQDLHQRFVRLLCNGAAFGRDCHKRSFATGFSLRLRAEE